MKNNKRIGLALSGGGFRATAFHLGTFRKLKELGILEQIDVISSISGGSILSALYGLECADFSSFEQKARKALRKGVIGPSLLQDWKLILFLLTLFSSIGAATYFGGLSGGLSVFLIWFLIYIIGGFRLFPIGRVISDSYDRILFKKKCLKDLPESPLIGINATNLESGRMMTFSKSKMSDSFYEFPSNGREKVAFIPDEFPLAAAVYASSCVPQFFSPFRINKKYFKNPLQTSLVNPTLIDGGIYDNQGIHKLTEGNSSYKCDYIIVSDAGNGQIRHSSKIWANNFWLLLQTIELFFTRIRNLQMRKNIYSDAHDGKRIAFISLKWELRTCINGFVTNIIDNKIDPKVIAFHGITPEEVKTGDKQVLIDKIKSNIHFDELLESDTKPDEFQLATQVGTNLTSLSEREINALIKRAEVLTELQIKLHCPDLLSK